MVTFILSKMQADRIAKNCRRRALDDDGDGTSTVTHGDPPRSLFELLVAWIASDTSPPQLKASCCTALMNCTMSKAVRVGTADG